jgi:hypothetical protein
MTSVRWAGWVTALLLIPGVSFGDKELAAEVAEMVESDLRDSCEDDDFLSCLKASGNACKSAVSVAIDSCRAKLPKDVTESELDKDPEAVTAGWSNCVTAKMTAALKITAATLDKCNTADDGAAP